MPKPRVKPSILPLYKVFREVAHNDSQGKTDAHIEVGLSVPLPVDAIHHTEIGDYEKYEGGYKYYALNCKLLLCHLNGNSGWVSI